MWLILVFLEQYAVSSVSNGIQSEIVKRIDCILGISTSSCPVNGDWSNWGGWSSCFGECGQVGIRERVRKCNNPLPSYGGDNCIGSEREGVECRLSDCTEEDYKELTKFDPLRSSEFQILHKFHVKSPALLEKCLFAECHFNIVKEILGKQADRYWNILHCVKHNNGCPVFGGWSQWGRWSECSAQYGYGKKIRCRTCDSPTPTNLYLKCKGLNCTTNPCQGSHLKEPKRGVWSTWSPWSKCTVSCGQGLRKRMRYCLKEIENSAKPDYLDHVSSTNGYPWIKHKYCGILRKKRRTVEHSFCTGPHSEIDPCYMKSCEVDGQWSDWEPWSRCSIACGVGVQSRSRACSSPPPSGGGAVCCGPYTWIRHCYIEPCQMSAHEVTTFSGNGALHYRKTNQATRLLHLYIKVKPVSLNGDILLRMPSNNPHPETKSVVKLSLVAGYVVFTSSLGHCHLTLVSQRPVKMKTWLQVLIMITIHGATMRIDDNEKYKLETFTCIPKLLNLDSEMIVGGNFTGQIQKLYVNFLKREMKSPFDRVLGPKYVYPSSILNVLYENYYFNEERSLDDLILIPCGTTMLFSVELVVRTASSDGLLMLVKHFYASRYLTLSIEPRRVVLKLVLNDCVYECFQTIENHIGKWTYIVVDFSSERYWGLTVNGAVRKSIKNAKRNSPITCVNNIYVGNVVKIINKLEDRNMLESRGMTNRSISGILAYVNVNNKSIDIATLPSVIEKGDVPFSSEAISITRNYVEVELLYGQQLNLPCLYGIINDKERNIYSSLFNDEGTAVWTRLDSPINPNNTGIINYNGVIYKILVDGVVAELRSLQYSSEETIEGFYSCWLPLPNHGAILTYGVTILDLGKEFSTVSTKILQFLSVIFILISAITIIWMFYEYWAFLPTKVW